MNPLSYLAALLVLCLGLLYVSQAQSNSPKLTATSVARLSDPAVNGDLLVVNRWERVRFRGRPDFWDALTKELAPLTLPELHAARGDEMPVKRAPRRKKFQKEHKIEGREQI